MSSKRVRGNPGLRRGLGSQTTDSDEILEDPPAGDWLTLRSDQLLEWIDNAVYNVAEATGMRELVNRVTRPPDVASKSPSPIIVMESASILSL